jgi:hypothetical protein
MLMALPPLLERRRALLAVPLAVQQHMSIIGGKAMIMDTLGESPPARRRPLLLRQLLLLRPLPVRRQVTHRPYTLGIANISAVQAAPTNPWQSQLL